MRIVYFTHSVVSSWNNGNAHFQRGLLRALAARGHDVTAYEPAEGWSRKNLLADGGASAIENFRAAFPELVSCTYQSLAELDAIVDAADLVIVHEWNDPALVAAIGRRRLHGRFSLFFHDTHHRAISDPEAMRRFDLSAYDGVLAFGQALAAIYESWGWRGRVFVLHEAADTALFRPPVAPVERKGAVWIGNWGDGERAHEIESFLLRPAREAGAALDVHGVRYPAGALDMLRSHGARYRGWLANEAAPAAFARAAFTVHVPRRPYTEMLPGIPTIRVFEALACGIPLITAPWHDCENLFGAGQDYLVARDEEEMRRHMTDIVHDPARAADLVASGLRRIRSRHSCDIRAGELLAIADACQRVGCAA